MIRGPTEIDFVPAAGDGQRGRVVPAQRQEQRTLPRGTCRDTGNEGTSHTVARGRYAPGRVSAGGTSPRVPERQLVLRGVCEHEPQRSHPAPGKPTTNQAQPRQQEQHRAPSACLRLEPRWETTGAPAQHRTLRLVTKSCIAANTDRSPLRSGELRGPDNAGPWAPGTGSPTFPTLPSQQPPLPFLPGACYLLPPAKIL